MQRFKYWKEAMTRKAMLGSQCIDTAKGRVHYTDFGTGPAVLHVHGSPAGCDVSPLMLGGLQQQGYRIITPSRPGFLKTDLSLGKTPEAQADVLAAFLDALEIDKVAVHAWSAGGPPALQFALRHPHRVSSLILLAAVTHKWGHRITAFERLILSEWGLWMLNNLHSAMPEAFRKRSAKELGVSYSYARTKPEKLGLLDAFFTMTAPASLRLKGSMNDVKQYRNLADYPFETITCPTLIVFSETDAQLPISHAELVAKRISNAEYHLVKGGHMPQADEDAERLDELTASFILKHSDSTSPLKAWAQAGRGVTHV